jgi:hypothetical protein
MSSTEVKTKKPISAQIADAALKVQERFPELAAEDDALALDSQEAPTAPTEAPPLEQPPADAPPADAPAPLTDSQAPAVDDWEDIEIEDTDNGNKYTVKAKKDYAQYVKDGYLRRSDYSRKTGKLAKHKEWLEPMINNGALDAIAPLIEKANSDDELATAFYELYQARQQGRPLVYGVQPQPQAQTQAQQYIQPQAVYNQAQIQQPLYDENGIEVDEYTRNAVQGLLSQAMTPMQQKIAELTQWQQQQMSYLQQQQQQQQHLAQQRAQAERQIRHVHEVLRTRFPQEFDGTQNDVPKLQELDRLANQAGYSPEDYGYVGRFLQARELKYSGYQQQQTGSASPAARTLADVEAQSRAAAAAAAASVARTTTSGSPIQPQPPQRLSYRGPDGKKLPFKDAVKIAAQNAKAKMAS